MDTIYKSLLDDIKNIVTNDDDAISSMANTCALIHQQLKCFWTGFYLVKSNQLVLGPFQGAVACSRIAFGKGVCGQSWKTKSSIIVNNVNEYEGHIACSAEAKSEIVCPIIKNNSVVGIIDLDSDIYGAFNKDDEMLLKEVAALLAKKF